MTVAVGPVTAIVLCGGRGSRMGGRDKPLLEYHGDPIVAHIVDALHGSVAGVLISANRNLKTYGRYGTVVKDELIDHGPLSGIATCLRRCDTEYAFICPGDAPNLDPSMIQRLAQALSSSDTMAAVAHDGQQRQNLHLLLRANAQPDIDAYLTTGGRSVRGWLESAATIEVNCADIAASLTDFDSLEDLPG
jgi:molybdopterin-guanine dinucleotide biosynthesis protein A